MLEEVADDLQCDGVHLLIARDVAGVRDVLQRATGDQSLSRFHPSVADAVRAAQAKDHL